MAMGIYDLGTARGVIRFTYDGAGIKKAQQDMSSVDDHSSKMHSHLASVGMMLGRVALVSGAVVAGTVAAVGAIGFLGLKTSSQVEQADIAFTTMLGSGQKAQAFLTDLADFAAKTPFEFPDLVAASQKLLAMGFQAKDVRPLLTSIGDAVAGLGGGAEQIDSVTRALGQMQAKGKVQADEMLQLTEVGIPAWQMLADKMGVSVTVAMDKVSKGQVQAGTMVQAFMEGSNKRFGGMMAKQSQTLAGLWSTLKDTVTMGLANAESGAMPALKKMVQSLITAAGPVMNQVGGLFTSLVPVITALADQMAPLISSLAGALGPAAPQIASFMSILFGGISDLIKMLSPSLPVLMQFVNILAKTLFDALKVLGPAIGPVLVALVSVVDAFGPMLVDVAKIAGPILGVLANIITAIAPVLPGIVLAFLAWKGAMAALQAPTKIFNALLAAQRALAVSNPIILIVAALVALVVGIIYAYKHSKTFRDIIESIWKALQTAWEWIIRVGKEIGGAFADAWRTVSRTVSEVWNEVWGILKKWGPLALAVLAPFIGIPLLIFKNWSAIVDFFSGLGSAIIGAFKDAGTWLLNAGKAILGGLWAGWKFAWDEIIQPFFNGIGLVFTNFFTKGAGQYLISAGKAILTGLWIGIKWIWDNILWTWYVRIPTFLIGLFAQAASWLIGAGRTVLSGLWIGIRWIWDNVIWTWYVKIPTFLIGLFVNAVGWLFNAGKNILTGLLNGIWSIASTIGSWIYRNVISPIINAFIGSVTWLVSTGSYIIRGLFNGMWNIASTVGLWLYNNVIRPIIQTFVGAVGWLGKAGWDIISGLFQGVINIMKGIGSWINANVVQPFLNAVKDFFGVKHSPSEIMKPIGEDLILGLFEGLIRHNPVEMVKKAFGGFPEALAYMIKKGLISIPGLPKEAINALSEVSNDVLRYLFPKGGPFSDALWGALSGLVDVPGDILGSVISFFGGGKSSGGAGANGQWQSLGKAMAAASGWVGAQWDALNNLVMGESGWNPNAQNPTSSAYGIAQNIGGRAGYPDPSPAGQIRWLIDYIRARYGTPANAWQTWLSRNPHWYDQGGFLPSGRPALVGVPELWIPRVNGMMFPLDKMNGGGSISLTIGDISVTGTADPEATADIVLERVENETMPKIVRAIRARR